LTVSSRELVGRYPTKLILEFNESFDIGELYSFNLNDFADCSGNTNDYSGTFVLPQTPDVGDIVINEFIPRVSPAVGMPEVQYVELYNRSNKYFYLENWKLSNNSTSGTIQGGWIYPGEYLLLVPTSGAVDYPSASIVSSWSSLKVTGDDVRLTAEDGTVVDFLTYTDAWYKDDLKKGEGWSIERINPELLCSSSDNWRASVDPSGGTPGIQNSIYDNTPDTDAPTVLDFEVEAPNLLTIRFSEPMDSLSLENTAFTSTPALTVSSRELVGRYPTKLTLEFNESFIAGETYTFSLSNFSDCSGNTNNYDGTFIIPQASTKGDLIINEILFNPLTGGSDFIELYNNSDKYIDMKDWVLANYKNDTISNQKKVIQSYVLAPHDYVVLTVDSNFQLMNYPVATPGKFIQMSSLPSYTNDSSTVYLIFNDEVMDKVSYSEKWHFSLLQSKKGVSLERFSADEPSNSASNWHSASETIGFATPGRINSQDMKPGEEGGTLTLSSNSFSPDGDGFEDALILTYEVSSPDLLGDLIIYDDKGRLIKVLFQKELLGGKGSVKWEGTKEDGTKAAIGPYIIMFDMFDLNSSKVKTVRKVVTLAGRL
ncbi:MAG TPA: lamin tail domain-containing protein, partial [Brumimicrobium sp.]|nr:lamin tail domain-containing protein [Brumimicrobium sp.]